MTDWHRQAEDLMNAADEATARGDGDSTRRHLRDAARAESAAFDSLPANKPRTRGVVAVSAVALLRKAGDLEAAIHEAHRLLSHREISDESRLELESLLEEAKSQLSAAEVTAIDGHRWALRGGRVGYGRARMDIVNRKSEQIQRFMWRVYEMLAGRPFRTTESVPSDVREAVDLVVGQAIAGSYAFDVLVGDYQVAMDSLQGPTVEALNTAVGAILRAVGDDDSSSIDELIPDPKYRDIIVAMVRNIAPDGREVGEVTVQELGGRQAPALLTPVIRKALNRRLRRRRPGRSEIAEVELRDDLRVIDLNRRIIALGPKEREQRCTVPEELGLVDLIQGLEDRPVRVRGHWQGSSFVVHDIEADYGDPNLTPSE